MSSATTLSIEYLCTYVCMLVCQLIDLYSNVIHTLCIFTLVYCAGLNGGTLFLNLFLYYYHRFIDKFSVEKILTEWYWAQQTLCNVCVGTTPHAYIPTYAHPVVYTYCRYRHAMTWVYALLLLRGVFSPRVGSGSLWRSFM